MRFATETRLNHLLSLIQAINDENKRKEAIHMLGSIRHDIEENYAEIRRPIRLHERDRDS